MATNQIYPFGTGGRQEDGDVMALADYLAEPHRLAGHQLGIARRDLINTTLRQVSHMAAGLALFIANRYEAGVLDDGDLTKVEAGLVAAVNALIAEAADTTAYALEDHTHTTAEITNLLNSVHVYSRSQRYAQTELEITNGSVTWNCEANPSATLLLTADVTTFTVTNAQPGGAYDLTVVQTGSWTLAMPVALRWQGGAGYEPSSGAGSIDRIYLAPVRNPSNGATLLLASVENGYQAAS